MFKEKYKTHLLVFSSAFLVRSIFFILLFVWITNFSSFDSDKQALFPVLGDDSGGYYQIAENLVNYGEFSENPIPPLERSSFRTPLYPSFVASVLSLGLGKIGVIIIQIILASLTAVLIYLLGLKFLSHKTGLLASVLFSIEPYGVFISGIILTEILFTFFLVLSIYLFVQESSFKNEILLKAGAGMALGLATLTRPLTIFLIPLGFLIILLMKWSKPKFLSLQSIEVALVFLFAVVLVLSPWMIRNQKLFGTYQLASNGPHNALFWNISAHRALVTGENQDEIIKNYENQISPTATRKELKSFEWTPKIQSLVLSYIKENWLSYSKFHLIKTIPFFVSDGFREIGGFLKIAPEKPLPNFTDNILSGEIRKLFSSIAQGGAFTIFFLGGVLLWSLLSLLMLIGTIAGLQKSREVAWFVFICTSLVLYLAIISAPLSPGRMRVVAEPFIFILVALGIQTIYSWWKKEKTDKSDKTTTEPFARRVE